MSLTEKFDQWSRTFEQDNHRNIEKVKDIYTKAVVDALSVPGDEEHPSKPGQAPHEVTGNLRASITGEASGDRCTARATAPYAKYLVGKRPFFRIAYEKVKAQIEQILLKK